MRQKLINKAHVEGRVYSTEDLKLKRGTDKNKTTYEQNYFTGSLDVAIDDACMNVVTIYFSCVKEFKKDGGPNKTFGALKAIKEGNKTVLDVGADAAVLVSIDTSIGVNDFYSENQQTKELELVSVMRLEGGFASVVTKLKPESERNNFEVDVLLNGTKTIEKNEERGINDDYLMLKGGVFNFRNQLFPVSFAMKKPAGIAYFEKLAPSQSNPVFTKLWGTINHFTTIKTREEETAFGDSVVKEYKNTVREWVIENAAKEPYEFGNAETGITTEDIQKLVADREVYLAEVKKSSEEYRANKAAGTTASAAPTPTPTAAPAAGGFVF